uniref:SFRICE_025837 n=1 Tax=Spodoptera frugiperda TaxID=7108 RepID=A0A2H1VUU2_SPOFR
MSLGCAGLQYSGVFMVSSAVDPGLQELQRCGRVWRLTRAESWELIGYNGTRDNFMTVSWENATQLITSGFINGNMCVVFIWHGFMGTPNTQFVPELVDAYIKKGCSPIAADWSSLANPNPSPNYWQAAANTETVGKQFGEALSSMTAAGLRRDKITLVGISLGGHVCGFAGHVYEILTSFKLDIVALDAAKPGFDPEFFRCITSTDAHIVLAIKTDPYGLGLCKDYGTHNVNFNPTSIKQPGCLGSLNPETTFSNSNLTDLVYCSHGRAARYFVEMLLYNCTMIAKKANSTSEWVLFAKILKYTICLIRDVVLGNPGNFYLTTNAYPLYGKGENGTDPAF